VTDPGVVVLGIPIPSSSPLFLAIVAVHVVAGIVCTVSGIVAMSTPKRAGRHPSAGTVYYWGLVVVFLTMAALSILRWPENTHLLALGILSFAGGVVGRMAQRRRWPGWLRVHVTAMAVSYIVLLTAFYVDNGPHLPLWRSLPPLALWLLPSLVGVPILGWVLKRHPLLRPARPRP
jgi:peptidoglycan/LPS O-acetylase OafA/YrhL